MQRATPTTWQRLRRAAARRSAAGLLAVAALILQLVAVPGSQAGTGTGAWIEICADGVAVMMQVETAPSGYGDDQTPCPECGDCLLCTSASQDAVVQAAAPDARRAARRLRPHFPTRPGTTRLAHAWPRPRGPPAAALPRQEGAAL